MSLNDEMGIHIADPNLFRTYSCCCIYPQQREIIGPPSHYKGQKVVHGHCHKNNFHLHERPAAAPAK